MNIKKMLQAPMRSRQKYKYEARIRDWILRKEEKERKELVLEGADLSVKCVSFSSCRAGFSVKNVGEGADILVFHADCGKPEEEVLRLFADFFARNPEAVLAYGDEDEVLPENGGRRTNPWLKPDWSPDTLISYFYFGNIFAVRTSAACCVSWLGDTDWKRNLYDFCLKLSEKSGAGHVDSVLFHGNAPIQPFGMEEEYADLKKEAYIRRGWPLEPEGMVSIVIPSKDNPGVLSTCIHSAMEASSYRDFEIIVIDNGSSEKNRARIERMLSQMTP